MFRQIQGKTSRVFQTLAFFVVVLSLVMGFFPNSAYAKSNLGGPANVACSRVRFVGVMGSGENDDKNAIKDYGMGGVVSQVYKPFAKAMGDKGIAVIPEGVDYDASPVWELQKMKASMDGGVRTLTQLLNSNKTDCIVLAGYSQGVMVIHNTLDDTQHELSLYALLRVKAVLAFGDPYFNPQGRGSTFIGNPTRNDRRYGGFVAKEDFPSWVFGVQSYCKLHDPICNSAFGDWKACVKKLSTCAHFDYYNEQAILNKAASWLAGLFATLISTANSVHPPRLTTDCGHLKTPWIALYSGMNYSGRELCFEGGTGWIHLHQYGFDQKAESINVAENAILYDHYGNQLPVSYGNQTGNLGDWNDRVISIFVKS